MDFLINFLEYLRSQRHGAKLLILWDGASYHRSQKIKDYLDSLNTNLEKEQWLITCVHICPKCTSTKPAFAGYQTFSLRRQASYF